MLNHWERFEEEIKKACSKRGIVLPEKVVKRLVTTRLQSLVYELDRFGFETSWDWDKAVVDASYRLPRERKKC